MRPKKPNVYVVSKGFHDWREAMKWGNVIFLAKGQMDRLDSSAMLRLFLPVMSQAGPDDMIVLSGLTVMCSVATGIYAAKYGYVTFLLWDGQKQRYEKHYCPMNNAALQELEQS